LPDKSGKLRFIAPVKQYAKAQHLREDALKAVCTHLRKEVQHQEWYQPIDTVCATIKKLVEDKKPLAQVLGFSCLDDTPSPSMLKHYQAYGDCLVNALTFLSLWHNFDLLAPKIIELHTGVIKRLPRDYHIEKINFATSNISCENRKSPIIHTSNLGDTLLAREFFYPQEDRSECASNTVDIIKNTLLLVTPEGHNMWLHIVDKFINRDFLAKRTLSCQPIEELELAKISNTEVGDLCNFIFCYKSLDTFFAQNLFKLAVNIELLNERAAKLPTRAAYEQKTSLDEQESAVWAEATNTPLNTLLVPAYGITYFFDKSTAVLSYENLDKSIETVMQTCALAKTMQLLFYTKNLRRYYKTMYSRLFSEYQRIGTILKNNQLEISSVNLISGIAFAPDLEATKYELSRSGIPSHFSEPALQNYLAWEEKAYEAVKHCKQIQSRIVSKQKVSNKTPTHFSYDPECLEYNLVEHNIDEKFNKDCPIHWRIVTRVLDKHIAADHSLFKTADNRTKITTVRIFFNSGLVSSFLVGLKFNKRGACSGRYISLASTEDSEGAFIEVLHKDNTFNREIYPTEKIGSTKKQAAIMPTSITENALCQHFNFHPNTGIVSVARFKSLSGLADTLS